MTPQPCDNPKPRGVQIGESFCLGQNHFPDGECRCRRGTVVVCLSFDGDTTADPFHTFCRCCGHAAWKHEAALALVTTT